jgi:alkanesulfonate monooxygenase SsuD/methylene tetrahydromethanopterin reductase-like flavin-dependent oxidoreductase (luciferase family)
MNLSTIERADARSASNPIFNDNKFKLGLFCHNASIMQMSTAPEKYVPTWPNAKALAELSDRLGLEAIVSFAGWRGPINGAPSHPSHREYETFTWCSALAAISRYPAVIATFHTQLTTPAFIAKAAATIDHVSGGRAGLNVVAGSSKTAFNQFGLEIEDHVTRYDHTEEFIEVLKRFWQSEEEFDHDGRFLKVMNGISWPKPVQRPNPPLVNAGISDRGRDFACRHADIAFTHMRGNEDDWRMMISTYKSHAAREYKRPIQVWTHGYVVLGETEAEANDYLHYYAEKHADQRWIDTWVAEIGENATTLRPEQKINMSRNWAAGGGYGLVGTADMIMDKLTRLSRAGLDGLMMTALEPIKMVERFGSAVMPLMELAGLRRPYRLGQKPPAAAT